MPRDQVEIETPRRPAATELMTPTALISRLLEALMLITELDEKGEAIFRKDDDERSYRALAPLIGHFVVADAAMALMMVYARGTSYDEVEAHAFYLLQASLSDFIANANISSVICAKARAHVAAMPMDDSSEHPSEYCVSEIQRRFRWDLLCVADGTFNGDRFGSDDEDGEFPSWFHNHKRRFEAFQLGLVAE